MTKDTDRMEGYTLLWKQKIDILQERLSEA